ncbi:MAG: GspH/FimT family protein [Pseudomonadota bacterium]
MDRPSRQARGLTLIELLLVLLMLGIALQAALPSFSDRIADLRSAAAMEQLGRLFSLARQEALQGKRRVTVCAVDLSGRCSRVWSKDHEIHVFLDSNGNHQPDARERRLRKLRWPMEGGELSWRASLARPYISFETHGGTWQNGTLYYCPQSRDPRQARALVLSHSGRAYLTTDSNGDGLREDRRGRNLSC